MCTTFEPRKGTTESPAVWARGAGYGWTPSPFPHGVVYKGAPGSTAGLGLPSDARFSVAMIEPAAGSDPRTTQLAFGQDVSWAGQPPASQPAMPEDAKGRTEGGTSGATVTADGKERGLAPGPFTLKNGSETKLTVSAKGYKTKELTVKAAPDLVVAVSLDRQAAGGGTVKGAGGAGGKKGIHSDLEGFDSK